jgi:hypothetical protein
MEKEKKYYLVKVTLLLEKKVKEQYLVEAVSVTDAEASVVKDFSNFGQDYEITSVSETAIVKVIK